MKLFKDYKWGIDLLGALLVALLLLPNIVYWCIPDFTGLDGNKALSVIGYVFEALGLAATLAIVRKEPQRFSFFSLAGLLTWLFLLLDYIAWVFFFCDFYNIAVVLFLAVAPCVALLAFQAERKNYIAMAPTGVFALVHLIAVLIVWL